MYLLVILFSIFIVCYFVYRYIANGDAVCVPSDAGKCYNVQKLNRTHVTLKENANALADVNTRLTTLIAYMKKKNPTDYVVKMLSQNYSPDKLSEAVLDPGLTTYTVDKEHIHMCLRTRDTQEKLYDPNLIFYVCAHEAAHMANYDPVTHMPVIGHGAEFQKIFKLLVQNAIECGVYTYVDYRKSPQEYCGLVINSSIL